MTLSMFIQLCADRVSRVFCVCSFQPAFRDTDRSRASLALYLAKTKGTAAAAGKEIVEMPGAV